MPQTDKPALPFPLASDSEFAHTDAVMAIRLICSGLAAGMILGGVLRWEGSSVEPAIPVRDAETPAVTLQARVPDLGTVPPAPPIEEVLDTESSEFLEGLVLRVAVSGAAELDTLLTALNERGNYPYIANDVIFLRWMEIDPAAGLAAARTRNLLNVAYWAWAKIDREAALAAAREESEPEALNAVLRSIGQGDPDRALELVEKLPGSPGSRTLKQILNGFAKTNPQRAVEESIRMGQSPDKYVRIWISRDPDEALPLIAEHLSHRAFTLDRAMDQLFQVHPERAAEIISALPDGKPKNLATVAYAAHLSHDSLDVAADYLATQPPSVRDHALGEMAKSLAITDPEAALEVLGKVEWENPPPNVLGSKVLRPSGGWRSSGGNFSESPAEALVKLFESGHHEAIEFLGSLPPGERSERTYGRIMNRWLERDSIAASTWLADQPAGPLKDAAISSMTNWLVFDERPDYESAARWALKIQDSEEMINRLHNIYGKWQQNDPTGVRAGLELPGLPQAISERYQPRPQIRP